MSIRSDALRWFVEHQGHTNNKTYTSRYYKAEESWSRKPVWWFIIPQNSIDTTKFSYVNLLCQQAPNKNLFQYLKVPTSYFKGNLNKFHRQGNKLSLYLSADASSLFVEERGQGFLPFEEFLI